MAIGPNKKREKQLEKVKEIVDLLEKEIDDQLGRIFTKNTVEIHFVWIRNRGVNPELLKNSFVQEEIRRRYVEKGWKDLQFEWLPSDVEGLEFGKLKIQFIKA